MSFRKYNNRVYISKKFFLNLPLKTLICAVVKLVLNVLLTLDPNENKILDLSSDDNIN